MKDRASRTHLVGAAGAATAAAGVWLVAFLAQWLLSTNPGYFSHDELQWASFAGTAGPIAWVSWLDVTAFQYRPLTFNLWLWLSRQLFDSPQAFHALLVAWGSGNAALLCLLARRLGVAPGPAIAGALAFALSAYATYVHGWIGTLGDLAWLSCALMIGLLVVSGARAWLVVVGTVLLTAGALLAKEAAMVIPAVLGVAWVCVVGAAEAVIPEQEHRGFRRSYKGGLLWAAIASAIVVAAYLALRLPVLLDAPAGVGTYQLDPFLIPRHWLEYQLFAFLPNVFEVLNTVSRGVTGSVLLAAVLWLGVVVACWRAHWRLAAFFLLGGIAMVAPVLPMSAASNQYGYGFAALAMATAAAAWPHARRSGRVLLSLAALACLWHGVNVMRTMRHVGEVQAVFSPALVDALQARADAPLRLRVAADAEEWIFQRLTFHIPSYRGVTIGDRVQLVAPDAPADAVIAADGTIRPL